MIYVVFVFYSLLQITIINLITYYYLFQYFNDSQCVTGIYTIEFQKRGLPHAHILLFLHLDVKNSSPDFIDMIISAEISDQKVDWYGYNAMKKFMIHGPCGELNPNSPCMLYNRCTKHLPKKFNE